MKEELENGETTAQLKLGFVQRKDKTRMVKTEAVQYEANEA